jgi:hypothetical protein
MSDLLATQYVNHLSRCIVAHHFCLLQLYLQSYGWLPVMGLAFQVGVGSVLQVPALPADLAPSKPASLVAYLQSSVLNSFCCSAPFFPPLQMRFRYQALACPLAFAVNITLLPAICSKFYQEQGARCVALGGVRVFLHGVLLPLACCFVFESHARRLFLRSDNRSWRA